MRRPAFVLILLVGLLTCGVVFGDEPALPMHPDVRLLDKDGQPVIETGAPVSPERSCGACHDTDYIEAHSYHVSAGHETLDSGGGLPWERGGGWLAGWDPISYRTLSRPDEPRADLDLAAWLRTKGQRHPGGGFAFELGAGHDCFVCHLQGADIRARHRDLAEGRFRWAATATLAGTGLVTRTHDGFTWNRSESRPGGVLDGLRLASEGIEISAPTSAHCGACHGPVQAHSGPLSPADLEGWNLETRGQVFSGQRMSASGLNLHNKSRLSRPFDVHAERLLGCTSCHNAPNRPGSDPQSRESRPSHLAFDPRDLPFSQFLKTPNHAITRGRDGSMRNCEDCHVVDDTHDWLPHLERHVDALRCEACHVPEVHVPARRVTDWTVITADGTPRLEYRGTDGDVRDARALVRPWQPVLLPRKEPDGRIRFTPYNVMAVWVWLETEPERPVRLADLEAAFLENGAYHAEIVRAFDADGNGQVGRAELLIDTAAKAEAVRLRLEAVGVNRPRLAASLWPYALHHTVATGRSALRNCDACHGDASRLGAAIDLGTPVFGDVRPTWQGDARVRAAGRVERTSDTLAYRPDSSTTDRYVVGHDRVAWIDLVGILACVGVVVLAGIHAAVRVRGSRRRQGGP